MGTETGCHTDPMAELCTPHFCVNPKCAAPPSQEAAHGERDWLKNQATQLVNVYALSKKMQCAKSGH